MSYSYFHYPLTDDEQEAGIGYLLRGDDRYYSLRDDDEEEKEYIDYLLSADDANIADQNTTNDNITNHNKERDNIIDADIIKLIAGLKTNVQIQNKVIKRLFLDNLDCMIGRYSKQQKLPYDYVKVAKQRNCLEILIKGFLKKNGNYILTSGIVREIDLFVEEIYLMDTDIIYERVRKIQKFIHHKIDEKNGKNTHLALDSRTMKNLLSSARLHLNLEDIKSKDAESLSYLIKQSEYASREEKESPTEMLSSSGEIYTTKKKIKDIKSLIDFGYSEIAHKIYDISNLNINIPLNEFRATVIQIYNKKRDYNPTDKPKWI